MRRDKSLRLDWYHLEVRGEHHSALFRECVEVVRSRIAFGLSDIPWMQNSHWDAPVLSAASTLVEGYLGHPATGNQTYHWTRETSFRDPSDQVGAEALVCFAPHSFSATFFATGARRVIELSDEGSSSAFRLTPEEAAQMTGVLGAERVLRLGRRR